MRLKTRPNDSYLMRPTELSSSSNQSVFPWIGPDLKRKHRTVGQNMTKSAAQVYSTEENVGDNLDLGDNLDVLKRVWPACLEPRLADDVFPRQHVFQTWLLFNWLLLAVDLRSNMWQLVKPLTSRLAAPPSCVFVYSNTCRRVYKLPRLGRFFLLLNCILLNQINDRIKEHWFSLQTLEERHRWTLFDNLCLFDYFCCSDTKAPLEGTALKRYQVQGWCLETRC